MFRTTSNAEMRSVATKSRYASAPSATSYRSRTFPRETRSSVALSGSGVCVSAADVGAEAMVVSQFRETA